MFSSSLKYFLIFVHQKGICCLRRLVCLLFSFQPNMFLANWMCCVWSSVVLWVYSASVSLKFFFFLMKIYLCKHCNTSCLLTRTVCVTSQPGHRSSFLILLLHKFLNFSPLFSRYIAWLLCYFYSYKLGSSWFGEVVFYFWHVSCCTAWLCYMATLVQNFVVNDLSLKFIIPTFLLFADDRKIWLDVKSAVDCKYLQCGSSVVKSYWTLCGTQRTRIISLTRESSSIRF